MRRFISITLLGLVGALAFAANTSEINSYYDKHIIIAVDQTSDVQGHDQMQQIKDLLFRLLTNQPIVNGYDKQSLLFPDFSFNPKTDCVELFAFAIEGDYFARNRGGVRNQYQFILDQQSKGVSFDELYGSITNALLGKRETWVYNPNSSTSFKSFFETAITPLLSKKDQKYQNCNTLGAAVTLSYYVYPLVLNLIDTKKPAKEYYLFMITNFESGSTHNMSSKDIDILNKWIRKSSRDSFNMRNVELESKYHKVSMAKYIPIYKDQKPPIITIDKIFPQQTLNSNFSNAEIESNITVQQQAYEGKEFKIGAVSIRNDSANVSRIEMIISLGTNEILKKVITKDSYNYSNKLYTISPFTYDIDNLKQGDTLSFTYVFYPKNQSKLPVVSIAHQNHIMQSSDFASRPVDPEPEDWLSGFILLIALVIVVIGLLHAIYCARGKRRKLVIEDFRIWPIGNTQYMDVTGKEVRSYDCWYWEGVSDPQRQISVTGIVKEEKMFFAKHYPFKVLYEINNTAMSQDSKFELYPAETDNSGSNLSVNEFHEAKLSSEGRFSFAAIVCLKQGAKLSFDLDNIIKLRVRLKRVIYKSAKNTTPISVRDWPVISSSNDSEYKIYDCIVRPKLTDSTLWMAFDLGTTGSCLAYGQSDNLAAQDNIFTLQNRYDDTQSQKAKSAVFPSKIYIPLGSDLFNNKDVTQLHEGRDYLFGNPAEQQTSTKNVFQSIKKLLGYTTPQKIYRNGFECTVASQDLAYLLARGIYNKFVVEVSQNKEQHRLFYDNQNGKLKCERAIVAVPNNFTLNKIQDMVDCVKRNSQFKEVHYIYESEGVFMTFLRKEFSKIVNRQSNVFVVYDMGGATINITAFKLNCLTQNNRGVQNIRSLEVTTIAKIGYCVGGDDIDYAIIQLIYGLPSVRKYFENKEDKILAHQIAHKTKLITIAREIKNAWIVNRNHPNDTNDINITSDATAFCRYIGTKFGNELDIALTQDDLTDSDENWIDEQWINAPINEQPILKKYVLDAIQDAVKELCVSLPSDSPNIELILSGRSILFPGVEETVMAAFQANTKKRKMSVTKWSGFEGEEIKTAVAIGACWYAMNSGKIRLIHNLITTSFGYLDTFEGVMRFIPLIDKSRTLYFNEEGMYQSQAVQPIDPGLNTITFVQMMGTNYDQIYHGKVLIPHKVNLLDKITNEQIVGQVQSIQIKLDNKLNFDYSVVVSGRQGAITKDTNRRSRLGQTVIQTEVQDENSPAYVFAVTNELNNKLR